MNRICLACTLAGLVLLIACARGTSFDPASPQLLDTEGVTAGILELVAPGHSLLGFFQVSVDPALNEANAVPLRTATWHLNALSFLEPLEGPSFITFSNVEVEQHRVSLDVSINHPFGGLPYYCGFDVKGVVVGCSDMFDPTEPSLKWGGGPDGVRVLNADGWTRWWNPTDFPDNGTIFSFREGMLGVLQTHAYDATLNGYKLFAASLEPDDPISHVLAVPLDHPNGRAVFHSFGLETRHYDILFPGDGEGGPDLVFNYAVDACHGFPPGYVPGEYIEVPDGFPPDANQVEPFIVDVQVPTNTAYLSKEGCVGGVLELKIRISDWQALLVGTPIADQIHSVEITSPTLFNGPRTPDLDTDWSFANPWAEYTILLEGITPDSVLNQQVLVTVVSAEGDYQPDVSSYSGSAPLASYYVVRVPVLQSSPIGDSGFQLNPLSPWPKPGGTIYNTNATDTLGPADPAVAWEIDDLKHDSMPVVDPEGRIYVAREPEVDSIELFVYDSNGQPVADLTVPGFEPSSDPVLAGCSLLWNDIEGNIIRLYQDGSFSYPFFTPKLGTTPPAFNSTNIDTDGHAFIGGASCIQAFNQYGSFLWARWSTQYSPSMFIGPLTVTTKGLVIVGNLDVEGGPPGEFRFRALRTTDGETAWTHTPEIPEVWAHGTAVDPVTGRIYYAISSHIVCLDADGVQLWIYPNDNYFLPELAIAPDGTIYGAESLLGQTGGTSRLVALTSQGQFLWDFDCQSGICTGPIVDSAGCVYFATDDGEIRCVSPDGDLKWQLGLSGRPEYLIFGPRYSLLVGFRNTIFKASLVCISDMD